MKKSEISLLCGFVLTVIISLASHQVYDAQQVCGSTLRLHIIANSNTVQDQQIKLEVRDKILKSEKMFRGGVSDFAEAKQLATENAAIVEKEINTYLEKMHAPYTAHCSVEKFYFDTTQYDGFVLPKGEYNAFTVRLGKAEGKNWWCVLYPALCSTVCGEIQQEKGEGFIKTSRITARFKVVEIYEDIKTKLCGAQSPQYNN